LYSAKCRCKLSSARLSATMGLGTKQILLHQTLENYRVMWFKALRVTVNFRWTSIYNYLTPGILSWNINMTLNWSQFILQSYILLEHCKSPTNIRMWFQSPLWGMNWIKDVSLKLIRMLTIALLRVIYYIFKIFTISAFKCACDNVQDVSSQLYVVI